MKIKLFGKDKKSVFRKRGIIMAVIAGILVTGLSGMPNTSMTETNLYVVEAKSKKDKKKPVIKFSGKTKITVEKNKSVKIPKTTAKDNKDGNVTKKITVTVKKGKKSYKSIAKKIKNNKSVKFTSTGTYKITYTVKDKAGNKASKTRTIKVVNPKKKTEVTTENKTTERVTTEEITTQMPTTEKITTETPTTERVTTETPTTEKPTKGIYQEIVNGTTYNVTRDFNLSEEKIFTAPKTSDKIKINIENDYDKLYFDVTSKLTDNSSYLKFLGKITATDENGNDISNNIIIDEHAFLSPIINSNIYIINIYVEDNNGNTLRTDFRLLLGLYYNDIPYGYDDLTSLILLNETPPVYGRPRVEKNNLSSSVKEDMVKITEE